MPGKRTATLACLLGIGWLLDGCASLDAQAVAETHRLGDAPYYVEIAQPQPARGSCAIVFPSRSIRNSGSRSATRIARTSSTLCSLH